MPGRYAFALFLWAPSILFLGSWNLLFLIVMLPLRCILLSFGILRILRQLVKDVLRATTHPSSSALTARKNSAKSTGGNRFSIRSQFFETDYGKDELRPAPAKWRRFFLVFNSRTGNRNGSMVLELDAKLHHIDHRSSVGLPEDAYLTRLHNRPLVRQLGGHDMLVFPSNEPDFADQSDLIDLSADAADSPVCRTAADAGHELLKHRRTRLSTSQPATDLHGLQPIR